MISSNQFYSFRSKLLNSTFTASLIQPQRIHEDYHIFYDLQNGNWEQYNFPFVFKQYMGGAKLYDLLDTGWPCLYLVSEKLIGVLKNYNITGWKTYEIEMYDKNNNKINGYKGLSIIGRSGFTDISNLIFFKRQFSPTAPLWPMYKGERIDEITWDGSDLFMPKKYYGIYTTQKVIDAFRKEKISNFKYEKIEEIEYDEDLILHKREVRTLDNE